MAVSIVIPFIIVLFLLQLVLCLRARKSWIRLLPVCLLLAGEGLCAVICLVCRWLERTGADIYGTVFAAAICAVLFGMGLAGTAAAWLLYLLVKLIQKLKK